MRVLIVEDDGDKASAIASVVESAGVDPASIIRIPDAVQARDCLRANSFDLLLLDLQLPNRFGDGATKDGGLRLLRWMTRHLSGRMPPQIVAISGYGIEQDLGQQLRQYGVLAVRYQPSQDSWREFVHGLVCRLACQTESTIEKNIVDAVVITAVDVETLQAKRVFGMDGPGESILGISWYRAPIVEGCGGLVLGQAPHMGMAAAAVATAKAIRLFNPDVVAMSGICGGLRGAVELGDIVVPNPCWDYGSGKLTSSGILKPDPRPVELRESMRLRVQEAANSAPLDEWRRAFRGTASKRDVTVHIEPAASGAAVVADVVTGEAVKAQSRKVVGIDMEAFGVYHSAANSGRPTEQGFFSAKTVVDFADPEKSDDFQAYGAWLSAKFVHFALGRGGGAV